MRSFRKSPWFKGCLAVLAVAILLSWVGTIFDDDGDVAGNPDFLSAVSEELQPLVSAPVLLGYNFSHEFRPLLNESFAHYLQMHEKSPPSGIPAF